MHSEHNQPIQPLPCVFVLSWDLVRICIRANYLSLVWDLPSSNMLEAAISVFALQARHVRARFECPGTLPSHNEYKIAIWLQNVAFCKFKKEPLTSNFNFFKLLRAKARKTIKQAKKISWQNYVNKLNSFTKTNLVWKMICKISDKNQYTSLKPLIKNNIQVTNIKDIVDTLAETFSVNFSSENSYTEFHKYKD